ncbi:MAG: gamma-glutamylcyclotransferase [Planctomycetota bacterium]|nr:gamma-glutamylcyclotransferase [Planctomycetota bacterium]MDA1179243.1 gamma-glutamylcyclotransferase [Planctomycetota bacterium]
MGVASVLSACQSIFVYGTLMRGECRERVWPCPPQEVLPARICGVLYDLGEYPALIGGYGWVEGELWVFAPQDVQATLSVLDKIEDTPFLYVRTISQVQLIRSGPQELRFAFVYVYANICDELGARLILPDNKGVIRWKR